MRVLRKDIPESSIILFSTKKLVRFFILKKVKASPDSKIIKLLTFDKKHQTGKKRKGLSGMENS